MDPHIITVAVSREHWRVPMSEIRSLVDHDLEAVETARQSAETPDRVIDPHLGAM